MISILAILLVGFVAIDAAPAAAITSIPKVRGCYYTNWSQHRPGDGQYLPELYESGLCSHIFFAYVGLNKDFKLEPLEKNDLKDPSNQPSGLGLYGRVNELKKKQSDLVTLLSFGGCFTDKCDLTDKMLANKENRQKFIADVVKVVREHKFDGFDFNVISRAERKENIALLIKEMREVFEKEKNLSKLPRLLLTIAVPHDISRIKAGYDLKALSSFVDYFNVEAFNYHSHLDNQTGFNSPITDNGDGLSINATIRHLIDEQQIPKEKIVMGLAAFGRGFTLPITSVPTKIPSPSIGPSPVGPFTNVTGKLAYFEICSMIEKEGLVVEWDKVAKAPFAYKNGTSDTIWISYDDVKSYKTELKYALENELAGVFVWTLDQDDFRGVCKSSNGKYPLINLVRDRLTKGGKNDTRSASSEISE